MLKFEYLVENYVCVLLILKYTVFFTSPSSGCSLNRLNSVTGQYAQACVQTAGQCGVDVLDLWSLMQKDEQVLHTCLLIRQHGTKSTEEIDQIWGEPI